MNSQSAAAHDHLPWFVAGPGQTDTLFVVTTIFVVIVVLLLGVLFFWLHSLPERLGHKKLQFEIVAVLGLLSLLTHIHLFWVIGLFLALIDLPDFVSPLRRTAAALEKLAGVTPEPEREKRAPEAAAQSGRTD